MDDPMILVLRDLLRAVSKKDPQHLEVVIDALISRARDTPGLRVEQVLDLLRPAVDDPRRLEAAMDSLIGHAQDSPALSRALVVALNAGVRSAVRPADSGAQ